MQSSIYRYWWCSGLIATSLILTLVGGSFFALIDFSSSALSFTDILDDSYIWHVIHFSIYQASLSTLLSIVFAIPLARAFSRREFIGKNTIIKLLNLSLVLPVIIAVFGIVAIHGKSGWVNALLSYVGVETEHYIYGLSGILVAHVFFNLPLATRVIYQAIESIPSESWRLASQLNFSSWHIFSILEWPKIKQQLPALISLIFMLCFTSFAIVMSLGGGPEYATLEVAIYQALKFDFDIEQAVVLALLQLVITLFFVISTSLLLKKQPILVVTGQRFPRPDKANYTAIISDRVIFFIALIFFMPPLLAIIFKGVNASTLSVIQQPALWKAAGLSLKIAITSGLLSLTLAFSLLYSTRIIAIQLKRINTAYTIESLGSIILVMPALVLSTGLFIMIRPYADVFSIAPLLVVLVNALMALPYILRILSQPMQDSFATYHKLASSLGMNQLQRLTIIEWPILRKPIGTSLALATVLSLGDLGAIALFGSQEQQTLPLYLYRQIGSYQLDAGAVTAIFLLTICGLMFYFFEHIIGGKHAK